MLSSASLGKWGHILEKNPTEVCLAEESLCKPCAEANNPYAEVLKVKSRVCPALSLGTDDDQRKSQLKKFFGNL